MLWLANIQCLWHTHRMMANSKGNATLSFIYQIALCDTCFNAVALVFHFINKPLMCLQFCVTYHPVHALKWTYVVIKYMIISSGQIVWVVRFVGAAFDLKRSNSSQKLFHSFHSFGPFCSASLAYAAAHPSQIVLFLTCWEMEYLLHSAHSLAFGIAIQFEYISCKYTLQLIYFHVNVLVHVH